MLRKVLWTVGFPLRCMLYAMAWTMTALVTGDDGNNSLIALKKDLFGKQSF